MSIFVPSAGSPWTRTGSLVALANPPASVDIAVPDNVANAFRIFETAAGRNYIAIDTINGVEAMVYGNNTSLVTHKFLCDGNDASAFSVQDNSAFNIFRADTTSNKRVHVASALYSCSITVRNATPAAFIVEDAAGIDLFNWSTVDDSLSIQNNVNNGATTFQGTGKINFVGGGLFNFGTGRALGAAASATLGTIGATGPTVAAQAQWLEIEIGGVSHFIAVWV